MTDGQDGRGAAEGRDEGYEAAWEIGRALAEIESQFEFQSLLAPSNTDQAWEEFRAGGFERPPRFDYPELRVDLDELRRRLSELDMSRVEDAALSYLLAGKRDDLYKELSLVAARNTPSFLPLSMALYDPVQQEFLQRAEDLLESLPPAERKGPVDEVGVEECRKMAEEEFEYYRSRDESFSARIVVRRGEPSFRASGGDLVFPETIRLERRRARALLQHEIGVHIVNHHNGARQPLKLLATGLASYEELQQALGTFAEYLFGGLFRKRMRTLAARIIVAKMAEERAGFMEAFRRLTRDYGFSEYTAFDVAARVFSAGGFTRDQIYLRGLIYLLRYLEADGELEPLYVGKAGHLEVPVIQELRQRGVLRRPPLTPRFFETEEARERLTAARRGLPLRAMVEDA